MTEEQATQQSPELSIQDLASLKSIIDVASQRGAFKPGEMTQVGQTYSKLEAFLNEIARQQEAQKTQEGTQESAEIETPQGE